MNQLLASFTPHSSEFVLFVLNQWTRNRYNKIASHFTTALQAARTLHNHQISRIVHGTERRVSRRELNRNESAQRISRTSSVANICALNKRSCEGVKLDLYTELFVCGHCCSQAWDDREFNAAVKSTNETRTAPRHEPCYAHWTFVMLCSARVKTERREFLHIPIS